VSTKIVEDRHASILAAVERGAYIVDRVHFEHEMVEPPRRLRLHEGERVMARIGMKEDGMNGRSTELNVDIVAQLQTEKVAVERLALLAIIDEQQHMAHALIASD
jgi:hypothetical protein